MQMQIPELFTIKCQEEWERKGDLFTSTAAVDKGLSKSNDTYTIDSYIVALATL